MSAEIDDIKDIGEEEYIIMNLDSRQMETDGTNWFVKNMRGERGFDEPIPYVTSIELVDSYIPNTFYNVEEYNNVFAFGTQLEHYVLNDSNNQNTRPVYSINDDDIINRTLDEITSPTGIPSSNFERKYTKLNPIPSNTTSTYVIRHQIFFENPYIPTPEEVPIIRLISSSDVTMTYRYDASQSTQTRYHYYLYIGEQRNTNFSIKYETTTRKWSSHSSADEQFESIENTQDIETWNENSDYYGVFVNPFYVETFTDRFILRFTINDGNTTVSNIDTFLIHMSYDDNSEIKKAVLERDGHVDVTVGRRVQNVSGEWVKPQGQFDMFTAEDGVDDIPFNVHLKIFSYTRVEYPIQNYTSDELMEATNKYITSHLRQILDSRRDDIVEHMPYETFLDLHLKLERNDRSKRFTFTSKHNHPFFIDLTEPRSITQELGFSHRFYTSNSDVETYNQKMSSSDAISSITVKELRGINPGKTASNTMLYQAFSRLFFDIRPSNVEIISENLVNIEPIFVNDYPFKRGELEIFGKVEGTLISYYGVLMLSNNYYILPFKPSFFNIFSTNTNASSGLILDKTDDAFYGDDYADFLNDKTFVDSFDYTINTQNIVSENIINLSGERYVDLVCVEIQNELKRYNAGYNKLYRYYFDDISDLYVTSTKGNVTDLVLRNPRDFGPVARLNKLTIQFIRSDGNPYNFKTIPFFVTIAIKYLKPVLRTEEVES